MSSLKFCDFETLQFQAIRNLLCETFNTSDAELIDFYRKLQADFNNDEWPSFVSADRSFFTSQDSHFQAEYDRAEIVSCDLPSLLSRGKGHKVMIIAQDPYSTNPSKRIGIGTPYAMHIKECREKLHTRKYFNFIDVLLEQEYQTYLTDVYKIYVGGVKLKKKDRQQFAEILKQEIEIINPTAIITWGSVATKAVARLNPQKPHYSYPHPSGAAKWVWARLIQERATDQNIRNYWKQDILKKLSSISEF